MTARRFPIVALAIMLSVTAACHKEPPPPPAPQAALTPEEVKAQCWMKFENDKRIKNLDARAALVDKCINETSRGQPPAR